MPIILTQGAQIPNHANPSGAQKRASPDAIGGIDYARIFGGPGTIGQDGQRIMRVDMQGNIPGPPIVKNLQVQINGIGGHTTVAHALVSTTLMTNDPANQRGVTHKVQAALNRSLDDGHTWNVNGTAP